MADRAATEYGDVPELTAPRTDGTPLWTTGRTRLNRNTDPDRLRRQANDDRSRPT